MQCFLELLDHGTPFFPLSPSDWQLCILMLPAGASQFHQGYFWEFTSLGSLWEDIQSLGTALSLELVVPPLVIQHSYRHSFFLQNIFFFSEISIMSLYLFALLVLFQDNLLDFYL